MTCWPWPAAMHPQSQKISATTIFEFHKGRIQDLEQFDKTLTDHSLSVLKVYLEASKLPYTSDLNPR